MVTMKCILIFQWTRRKKVFKWKMKMNWNVTRRSLAMPEEEGKKRTNKSKEKRNKLKEVQNRILSKRKKRHSNL